MLSVSNCVEYIERIYCRSNVRFFFEAFCCWRFFFQAEDGIREKLVTGVQTCALPISGAPVDAGVAAYAGDRPLDACGGVVRPPGIGRASCRERVEISVVAVALTK